MDFMRAEPMKSESYSVLALQHLARKHGVPRAIKTDSARTETGAKGKEHCRCMHAKQKYTEPHSEWQNHADHKVNYLSVVVIMRCTQHHWVQHWCVEARNVVASRKLKL